MTFYRKHRPQKISELDLEQVRKSLYLLSRKIEEIPHAFLFSGPRGTGKTSAARILAKLLNCENLQEIQIGGKSFYEPCDTCEHCTSISKGQNIDVVELDAASNRGIDDIRALRENINLSPVNSKKKVYIIDEAHMLTNEAANAFLKTLEEPPSHVIFVLATTEPEKLPLTVVSRLSRVDFKKAKKEDILRQIKRVAKSEGISFDENLVSILAEKSDGSFRDAAKIFETLATSGEEINLENAQKILNSNSSLNIESLASLIANKDSKSSLKVLNDYSANGGNAKELVDKLINIFRLAIYSKNDLSDSEDFDLKSSEIIRIIDLLLEARSKMSQSPDPIIPLEIAVVKWSGSTNEVKKKTKNLTSPKAALEESNIEKRLVNTETQDLNSDSWLQIMNELREKNASIEALLRATKPKGIEGNILKLGVYYRFHMEQLESVNFKKTLEEVCSNVLGRNSLKVNCFLEEKEKTEKKDFDPPLVEVKDTSIVDAAKDVFS